MVRPLFCSSEYMVDDRGFVLSKLVWWLTVARGDILMRIVFGYLNKVV